MKSGWKKQPFEDCIEPVTYTQKIQRKDFLHDGAYPVVSQEEDFINDYWDNEADLFKVTTPIVVFGDRTKVLKYVDFDFVLGADGVKILQPREFLLPKFFFYSVGEAMSWQIHAPFCASRPRTFPCGRPSAREKQMRAPGLCGMEVGSRGVRLGTELQSLKTSEPQSCSPVCRSWLALPSLPRP